METFKPDYAENERLTNIYNSIGHRSNDYLYPACEPPTLSGLTPILSRGKEAKKITGIGTANNLARKNGHLHVGCNRDAKVKGAFIPRQQRKKKCVT